MEGTLESVSPSQVHESRQKWSMPECNVGTPVVWYEGNRRDSRPWSGNITFVNRRNKTVIVHIPGHPQGESKEQCRHVSDPVLALGRDVADGGCWDFSLDYLETKQRLSEIEARLADVERGLATKAPSRDNKNLKGSKTSDFKIPEEDK